MALLFQLSLVGLMMVAIVCWCYFDDRGFGIMISISRAVIIVLGLTLLSTPFYVESNFASMSVLKFNEDGSMSFGAVSYFCTDNCVNLPDNLVNNFLWRNESCAMVFDVNTRLMANDNQSGIKKLLGQEAWTDYSWPVSGKEVTEIWDVRIEGIKKDFDRNFSLPNNTQCHNADKIQMAQLVQDYLDVKIREYGYRIQSVIVLYVF
ncbi:hypothetical protein COT97_03310 [Candidatus Falkowbacteria bacterium CG10_big_fil_rev_8_21_14_0_10_39_11]|uniref:Uncharacterized protein n=1 Tax=Candidatus Falkowbacteria bacterium CG10_big_fil_rev_8_21_14_0_10_39_11 TaxID=1974565 RepID=A0A2H0V4L6_9BACT|nr:MAG: hypothetical protein COT97_03310 [Candidatus Falkowbacteria bacterium CG10_big_fil_rev_8_21_14_0_10_39_11]